MTIGHLLQGVYALTDADDDKKKEIMRVANTIYYQLISSTSFQLLRTSMTLDFSSADSDGIWLPADLAGIDYIADTTRAYEHVDYPFDGDTRYRYYYSDICISPLAHQKATIKSGATSFTTTPALVASLVGKYAVFGDNLGRYKLDTTTSIETRFMGESIENKLMHVHPEGTKKISCINDSAVQITTSVTMYYWTFPPPLYDDAQTIMLPDTRAFELAILARAVGEIDRRYEDARDYRIMYAAAKDSLDAANRRFIPPLPPIDRDGEDLGYGSRP